jgi:hypothetical protein
MNTQSTVATPAAAARLGQALRRRLFAVLDVIASASAAMACAREAERLMQLTDAELAARGLRREEVVRHAFARYLSA